MFRLFCMDNVGRMFQLGSQGWLRSNGTNFPTMSDVRDFVYATMIPAVPNELDAFIARVGADGLITETFPVLGN